VPCIKCNADGVKSYPSKRGYAAPFIPGEVNYPFWCEVLVGRTIKEVLTDETDGRITTLVLDDGQCIELMKNCVLAIQD
jgi:hypothetical protein